MHGAPLDACAAAVGFFVTSKEAVFLMEYCVKSVDAIGVVVATQKIDGTKPG